MTIVISAIWTLVLHAAAWWSGWIWSRLTIPRAGCAMRGLSSALWMWAWITWGLLWLGHWPAGFCRLGVLGWLTCVIGLGYAPGMIFGLRGVGGGWVWGIPGAFAIPPREERRTEGVWPWSAVLALAATVWLVMIMTAETLRGPVRVVSDGPIYHLYFAATWWRDHQLSLTPVAFGESAATYFPAVGEIWFTWLMICWDGDALAHAGQVPFLILAAYAAYAMARLTDAPKASALVAACWWAACSPLLIFTMEGNVDTVFCAGYILCAYFLMWMTVTDAREESRDRSVVLPAFCAGLAGGLAWATKPTGTVFVPPLLIVGCVVLLRGFGPGRRAALGRLAAFGLGVTAIPMYWWARNARLTGNPLYPLHWEIAGRPIFRGWYDRAAMAEGSPYYLPWEEWRAAADILMNVLDPRTALFWLMACTGAMIWAPRGVGKIVVRRWVIFCGVGMLVNLVLFWCVIPYRTQQRFVLQGLALGVIPLAWMWGRFRFGAAAGCGLLLLHIFTGQTWPWPGGAARAPWDFDPRIPNAMPALWHWPRPEISLAAPMGTADWETRVWSACIAIFTGTLCFWAFWVFLRQPAGATQRNRGRLGVFRGRLPAVLGLTAAFGLLLMLAAPRGKDSRLQWYPVFPDYAAGWTRLDRLCAESPKRIAYAGTNIPFYLMGPELRNSVRYVPLDGRETWRMHDYHRAVLSGDDRVSGPPLWPNARPGWDRSKPNRSAWLAAMERLGVDYLVVTRANPGEGAHNPNPDDPLGFPVERAWAESDPAHWEPVYGVRENDPLFRIFRFRIP